MPRRPQPPTYPARPHKSGQARLRLDGRDVYLGPFGSAASRKRFREVLAEWWARPAADEPQPVGRVETVAELLDAIARWVEARYKDGPMTGHYGDALRPVHELYADAAVEDFGPVALKRCRQRMLETCCRNTANQRVRLIQFAWRQMASDELIDASLSHRLDTVTGLRMGVDGAVDYEEVAPVPEDALAATLPYLPAVVRALVEVQLLTGARPGELVTLRPADLQRGDRVELRKGHYLATGGKVWARVFRRHGVAKRQLRGSQGEISAPLHKTAHHGHSRVILFGPRAQAILAPLMEGLSAGDPVFRTGRGTAYATKTYCRAVARAVEAASRARACPACRAAKAAAETARRRAKAGVTGREKWRPWLTCQACAAAAVAHWWPHRLRHNSATYVVAQFGEEIARVILGHRTLAMTRRYAMDPLAKAIPALAGLEEAAVRVTQGNGDGAAA